MGTLHSRHLIFYIIIKKGHPPSIIYLTIRGVSKGVIHPQSFTLLYGVYQKVSSTLNHSPYYTGCIKKGHPPSIIHLTIRGVSKMVNHPQSFTLLYRVYQKGSSILNHSPYYTGCIKNGQPQRSFTLLYRVYQKKWHA